MSGPTGKLLHPKIIPEKPAKFPAAVTIRAARRHTDLAHSATLSSISPGPGPAPDTEVTVTASVLTRHGRGGGGRRVVLEVQVTEVYLVIVAVLGADLATDAPKNMRVYRHFNFKLVVTTR